MSICGSTFKWYLMNIFLFYVVRWFPQLCSWSCWFFFVYFSRYIGSFVYNVCIYFERSCFQIRGILLTVGRAQWWWCQHVLWWQAIHVICTGLSNLVDRADCLNSLEPVMISPCLPAIVASVMHRGCWPEAQDSGARDRGLCCSQSSKYHGQHQHAALSSLALLVSWGNADRLDGYCMHSVFEIGGTVLNWDLIVAVCTVDECWTPGASAFV